MPETSPLLGADWPVPKGWVSLADAYSEVNIALMNDDFREASERFGTGVEGTASAIWTVLDMVTRVSVLTQEAHIVELELDDETTKKLLRPRPLLENPKKRSENAMIALSHGTIGSGDADERERAKTRERWGTLWGRPVLLDRQQFGDAMEAVGLRLTTHQGTVRRTVSEQEAIKKALEHIRHNGMENVKSKETLREMIAPEMGPRPWKRVWDELTKRHSELSKPGRPKASSRKS
jgi:hypothetical protein